MTDRIDRLEAKVDAALGRQTERLPDFSRFIGKPVEFCEEVLKVSLYDKQRELIEAAEANKLTAVKGCHGSGKDFCLACLILYRAFVRGQLCLVTSATERQLRSQVFREIRQLVIKAQLPCDVLELSLIIAGERRVIGMTSSSTDSLTGWHHPKGVFVAISESQAEAVEASAFDSILANTVDNLSSAIVAGNAVKAKGRFFECFSKRNWHCVTISAYDTPNVVAGDDSLFPGMPTLEWIAQTAAEYGGESSGYFRTRVLAEFALDDEGDALVTREQIENAFRLHESGKLHAAASARGLTHHLALDVGRGVDASALAQFHGSSVCEHIETFDIRDLMALSTMVHKKSLELGMINSGLKRPDFNRNAPAMARIVMDSAGLGLGAYDRLRELGARVEPYFGGAGTKDSRFNNTRSAAYFNLRDLMQRGAIALPRLPALQEQLLATTWSLTSTNKIMLAPKDDVKSALGGASPDELDAVVMGCRPEPTPPRTLEVFL